MPLSNVQINPAQNFKVTFTVDASAVVNTPLSATIFQSLTDNVGVAQINVPPNQIWKVVDFYISTSSTPDLLVDLTVSNTTQNINFDLNAAALSLGTTRLNTFAYMQNGGLFIGANATLQVKAATQAANGTTAVTISATMVIVQYPVPK